MGTTIDFEQALPTGSGGVSKRMRGGLGTDESQARILGRTR